MAFIKYISPAQTELNIRRYNFETKLNRVEKKFLSGHSPKKLNPMEELLELSKKYKHLTD